MIKRIPTGIPKFDKLIKGGFIDKNLVLLSGTPGTAKSIFCLHALYNMAKAGDRCLYVTLEEKQESIFTQVKEFNWIPSKVKGKFDVVALDGRSPDLIDKISARVKKGKYNRLVVDSLVSVASSPVSPAKVGSFDVVQIAESIAPIPRTRADIDRDKIKRVIDELRNLNIFVMLTTETSEEKKWLSRDTISEFLCDTIIEFYYIEIGVTDYRTLLIRKMRLSDHEKGLIPFNITNKGITLLEKK